MELQEMIAERQTYFACLDGDAEWKNDMMLIIK
jgi:hypothetical protein